VRIDKLAFQKWVSGNFVALHKLRWCLTTIGATGQGTLQRVLEGVAKVAVEVRVDERI